MGVAGEETVSLTGQVDQEAGAEKSHTQGLGQNTVEQGVFRACPGHEGQTGRLGKGESERTKEKRSHSADHTNRAGILSTVMSLPKVANRNVMA